MRTIIALLALLTICTNATAAEEDQDNWSFTLTPYMWLPTISADLSYDPPPDGGGGGPSIDVGPTDWLDLLNGVAMIGGSARHGKFALHADFVWLSLKSENDKVVAVRDGGFVPVDASLNLGTETNFDGMTWTLAASYVLRQTDRSSIEILGGVRFLDVDIDTSWNLELDIDSPGGGVALPAQGNIGREVELWDGIVGVRGRFAMGEGRWQVPFYLDVGTGDSELTWQAMAGVSYGYDWGDLMLVFRHLDFDEGADNFLQGLALTGPAFGARFRF